MTRLGGLEVGDILPDFTVRDHNDELLNLDDDSVAGKPTLLVMLPGEVGAGHEPLLREIDAMAQRIGELASQAFVLTSSSPAALAELHQALGLSYALLADPQGKAFQSMGLAPAAGTLVGAPITLVVLRANRHVAALFSYVEGRSLGQALSCLEGQAKERQPMAMTSHPPVLIVPDVFSAEDCQRLITIFNLEGNVWVEPGHGDKGMTSDYKMKIPEYGRGDRVDHWVITPATRDFISRRLQTRLFPEISKAFHYQVTKAETYRIARYEGERGGQLHGHRDNASSLVAHRRFAVSVNLNTEEFTGGELRFPEFGDQRYRPQTGAAIAFSSSLLHEVMQLREGRRFALLAFVFGDR